MPADWRYNPYTGVMESVNITDEIHVIPSNAPYYIRLSEVPEKTAPSTLTIRFEDNTPLTEVAANPEPGQFWPDYNTSDEDINSGLVRFNSGDAGKVVKVNYQGTGTLVSVKSDRYPSWWVERGNASLGNKICVNGEIFEGIYNYNNFTVPNGVTIYVNSTAKILCQGAFINNGTIIGDGRAGSSIGYFGGTGSRGLNGNGGVHQTGYDPAVAYNNYQNVYTGSPSTTIINRVMLDGVTSFVCGSQGGTGGTNVQDRPGGSGGFGGAGIIIVANVIQNSGVIGSQGLSGGLNGNSSGGGQGGGGGGGVVIMIATNVKNTGTIFVNGGNNGASAGWYQIVKLGVSNEN